MIDHTRILTGYDIEVLLGAGYFLTIFEGAYDAGEIPDRIPTDDQGGFVSVGKPISVTILPDGTKNPQGVTADIELVIPVQLVDWNDVIIGMALAIETDQVKMEYRYLDETTRGLIAFFGLITGQPDMLEKIETQLANNLNRSIPMDFTGNNVAEMKVRKVPEENGFQSAYGLYLNLNLKIASQDQPPEQDFIPRGDMGLAKSFLPAHRTFVVGIDKKTFNRMANDMWHGFGELKDNGTWHHPVKDKDKKVGEYRSVSITPKDGKLKVTVKSVYFINNWPDADITATFLFTPRIENGKLLYDIKLTEFDADTGLLGDFLAFLIGGLLGALIGAFFGPVGIAIGAAIGGVGGIATIEITEAVLEGQYDDRAEEEAKDADVTSAFSAFPVRKRLFTDDRDPFYHRHYEVVSHFDEANIDRDGMSLAGHAVMEQVNEPVETMIIDKKREASHDSWNGLASLKYRLASIGEVEMPIGEVLRRIPMKQIQCVRMRPRAVRRKETIVTDIQFESRVDFHVHETVALQDAGGLVLTGFRLIHPKKTNPYYRAWADHRIENNFESLPFF
ncbi:MAG: hypothetical protein ACP5D1_13290 [Bacteroidales bacterium]